MSVVIAIDCKPRRAICSSQGPTRPRPRETALSGFASFEIVPAGRRMLAEIMAIEMAQSRS